MTYRLLINRPDRSADLAPDPVGTGPRDFHRRLPGYQPTELRSLPAVAERLGLAAVLAKVERLRFGLPSYKILGASWATYRAVTADLDKPLGAWSDVAELRALLAGREGRLVAATDGNHGRAVARMAGWLGWAAHILVPAGTAQARIDGIAGENATVEVVDGSYDEAVRAAARLADGQSLVISDTSWPGYVDVPGWVIEGYGTIFAEVGEQVLADRLPEPTHVVVPVGVGALAAAAVRSAPAGATLVSVEPTSAACVLASVAAGTAVEVPGPHSSCMAGLNCGLPSPLALPLVAARFAGFVAIDDAYAEEATRVLAAEDLAVGESAAASLGGLLALSGPERLALGLDSRASALLVLTEGVTDPQNYARITGSAP